MVLHLLRVPSRPYAELEASLREQVDGRGLLGGQDRVALGEQRDAGAEPEPARDRGGSGEPHEGIEGMPVLSRKLGAARPGTAPAARDMRVLGNEERLEPARLGFPGELIDANAVVGGEDRDTDVHVAGSDAVGDARDAGRGNCGPREPEGAPGG